MTRGRIKGPALSGLRRLTGIKAEYWALASLGWFTLAAGSLPPATPWRVTAVFLFTLVVPGFALSSMITTGLAERWVMTVALSVALAIVVSVVMTALRNDSMSLRIALLALVTTVAALARGLSQVDAPRADAVDLPEDGVR